MDRKMIYPGQIPLETDLLDTNRFALIGLGKLAAAVLGTTTLVNGLACTPTAPASMQVQVAAGEIYSLQNLDGTAYSSLAADTTHSLLKQGLLMDAVNLTCPAPATSGQSVNYLVQAIYQDIDAQPLTLPYYNASNPTQAYSGPAGGGTAQNTVRKGVCTVSVKSGIAATAGSQQTPAPDAGYVGLYSVTVAYGQTSITAGNIAAVSGAPFINSTLFGANPAFTVMPTSPTPPQFDNSTKSATTAFVQRALGSFANNRARSIGSAVTLSGADAGTCFELGASAAVTLPLCSSVPIGTTFVFTTSPGVTTATINRQGTDVLAINNGAVSTPYTMGAGSDIMFINDGSVWRGNFGSETLRNSNLFAASKAASGYQKLPSGLIIQWGSVTPPGSGTGQNFSLPIAFPNAGLVATVTHNGGGSNGSVPAATSLTTTTIYVNTFYAAAIQFFFIAIGY